MSVKLQKITLYILAFYTIFGFFLLPYILKSQLPLVLEEQIDAHVKIQSVALNPFSFTLQLSGVELEDLSGNKLFSLKKLYLNLEPHALFKGALELKTLILYEPQLFVVLQSDKTLNLASVVKTTNKQTQDEDLQPQNPLPRIVLGRIELIDGSVDYKDYTNPTPFDFSFHNLGFLLENIDTQDLSTSEAKVRFYSSLEDGGFIDFKSNLLSLEPLEVEGSLDFEASQLYTQWRYFKDMLRLEVANGKLSFHAHYKLGLEDLENMRIDDLRVDLKDLRIKPKDEPQNVLTLQKLSLRDGVIEPFKQTISIQKLGIESLDLQVRRDTNETIDWLEYIKVDTPANQQEIVQEPQDSQAQEPFEIHLKHFFIKDSRLGFEDNALPTKAHLELDAIAFDLYDFDSKEGSWLDYNLSMRANRSGTLTTQGELRHTPLKQNSRLQIKDLSLKALNPYIQAQSFVRLDDAKVSMNSQISYAPSLSKPDLVMKGSFGIDDLSLSDIRDDSLLFSFAGLKLNSFTYEYAPDRLYINEVAINSFFVNAIIDAQKNLNLNSLMKDKNSPKELEQTPSKPFDARIAKVKVSNGRAKFADLSLPLRFATDIHSLNGVIFSLSTVADEASIIKLAGEVDTYGTTNLRGSIDSSDPKRYTDIKFSFDNLALSSLSGYSASFAGYAIDDGKLHLDLSYDILNSKLQSSNRVVIDKIILGEIIEDANVTQLPLGFVIALLEDKDGIIDIDLPIEGEIDNPEFHYRGVLVQTLKNLIIKAVSSPFMFLASAMGIEDDKLEFAEFESGRAVILAPQKEKFDAIVKILENRPKIALVISGNYDKQADAKALRYQKLIKLIVLKSGQTNKEEQRSALNAELLEEIFLEFGGEQKDLDELQEVLLAKYEPKAYKVEYIKALMNKCSDLQVVTQEEIEALANKRLQAIYNYFVVEKNLDPKQLQKGKIFELLKEDNEMVQNKLEITIK